MRLQSSPVSIGIPSEKTMGIGVFKRQAHSQNLFAPQGWWGNNTPPAWIPAGNNTVGFYYNFLPDFPLVVMSDNTDGATMYLDADEGVVTNTLHLGRSYRLTGLIFGVGNAPKAKLIGESSASFLAPMGAWASFDLTAVCSSDFKFRMSTPTDPIGAGASILVTDLRLEHV
jgi:hypothetical protein